MPGFDQSTSLAILFGVAEYRNKKLFEPMPWIENNLSALSKILSDSQIVGFTRVLTKLNPSMGDIAEELDAIRSAGTQIDTLFIYYCGHGVVEAGEYFLTGIDAGATPVQKFPFDRFEKLFLRINAKRKILILDSCFSGRAISHSLADVNSVLEASADSLTQKEKDISDNDPYRQGTFVLCSADRDQPAKALDESGEMTAFTSVLINRLRNGIAGRSDLQLPISTVVQAVRADAVQRGLPEPVTSDKRQLGGWAFFGNAAVFRQGDFTSLVQRLKTEWASAIQELKDKTEARIASIERMLMDTLRAFESSANKFTLEKTEARLQSIESKLLSLDSTPKQEVQDRPSSFSPLGLLGFRLVIFYFISLAGVTLLYITPVDVSAITKLSLYAILSILYVLLFFGFEIRKNSVTWIPAAPKIAINDFIRYSGATVLFWGSVIGLLLMWFGPIFFPKVSLFQLRPLQIIDCTDLSKLNAAEVEQCQRTGAGQK
jgi:hypothetical protein